MHRITKRGRAHRGHLNVGALLALVAIVAAALLGAATPARATVGNCTPDPVWGVTDATFANEVVALVNQHRQALGLATLGVSSTLTASADWKSLHMGYYGYMQHDDPAPPVARTVSDRLAACGYPIGSVGWGENIAYGYSTPQAVMTAWLNSSGHRANIENPTYRAIGVGVARGSNGLYYWTQDFGTLLDSGSTTTPPPPTVSAPTVKLTSVPAVSTTSTSASFAWSTSGSPTSVTCSLDGGAAATCSSPRSYGGLAAGSHTFVVRVANSAGASSASYGWTVSSTAPAPAPAPAPTVTLTSAPSVSTTSSTASFAWSTTGTPTSVTCSLDGAPATACVSPAAYLGLAAGTHRFVVRAANASGSASAAYDWTIGSSTTTSGGPAIAFTSVPPASTTWTTAIFSWTLTGTATSVTCSLDGGPAYACTSPRAMLGLARGTHRFVVTAYGSAGARSAAYSWTVTS